MKQFHPRPITALIPLFLLSPSLSLAQFNGNVTTVTGTPSGSVCGNNAGSNDICRAADIPAAGAPADVTGNTVRVETTGSVTGDACGGGTQGNGTARNNTPAVRDRVDGSAGGSAGGSVWGGRNDGIDDAADKTVTIESGGSGNGSLRDNGGTVKNGGHDGINLDLSARYRWPHRQGETAAILGERVRFDDIDSHRIHLGGRLNSLTTPVVRPGAGLYGEDQCAGLSRAGNLTVELDHSSLTIRCGTGIAEMGGTGIAEMGVSVTPEDVPGLSLEASIQRHLGQREGIVDDVALNWKF